MSIMETVARLRVAKDALIAALTAKGVGVPDGAGFEDFPALTEEIATGGGDADLLKSIAEGTATDISFGENVTHIKTALFKYVTSLKSFDFSHIETIGDEAFYGCTGLEHAALSAVKNHVTKHGKNVFYGCTSLKSVDIPLLTSITSSQTYWFSDCTALETVNAPKLTTLTMYMFRNCKSLTLLDFPSVTSISPACFDGCNAFKVLILRRTDKAASLSNVNVFASTPFAEGGTGGTVYVPQVLIEEYKTATNWSVLYEAGTCNFLPIEGSEYE